MKAKKSKKDKHDSRIRPGVVQSVEGGKHEAKKDKEDSDFSSDGSTEDAEPKESDSCSCSESPDSFVSAEDGMTRNKSKQRTLAVRNFGLEDDLKPEEVTIGEDRNTGEVKKDTNTSYGSEGLRHLKKSTLLEQHSRTDYSPEPSTSFAATTPEPGTSTSDQWQCTSDLPRTSPWHSDRSQDTASSRCTSKGSRPRRSCSSLLKLYLDELFDVFLNSVKSGSRHSTDCSSHVGTFDDGPTDTDRTASPSHSHHGRLSVSQNRDCHRDGNSSPRSSNLQSHGHSPTFGPPQKISDPQSSDYSQLSDYSPWFSSSREYGQPLASLSAEEYNHPPPFSSPEVGCNDTCTCGDKSGSACTGSTCSYGNKTGNGNPLTLTSSTHGDGHPKRSASPYGDKIRFAPPNRNKRSALSDGDKAQTTSQHMDGRTSASVRFQGYSYQKSSSPRHGNDHSTKPVFAREHDHPTKPVFAREHDHPTKLVFTREHDGPNKLVFTRERDSPNKPVFARKHDCPTARASPQSYEQPKVEPTAENSQMSGPGSSLGYPQKAAYHENPYNPQVSGNPQGPGLAGGLKMASKVTFDEQDSKASFRQNTWPPNTGFVDLFGYPYNWFSDITYGQGIAPVGNPGAFTVFPAFPVPLGPGGNITEEPGGSGSSNSMFPYYPHSAGAFQLAKPPDHLLRSTSSQSSDKRGNVLPSAYPVQPQASDLTSNKGVTPDMLQYFPQSLNHAPNVSPTDISSQAQAPGLDHSASGAQNIMSPSSSQNSDSIPQGMDPPDPKRPKYPENAIEMAQALWVLPFSNAPEVTLTLTLKECSDDNLCGKPKELLTKGEEKQQQRARLRIQCSSKQKRLPKCSVKGTDDLFQGNNMCKKLGIERKAKLSCSLDRPNISEEETESKEPKSAGHKASKVSGQSGKRRKRTQNVKT